MEAAAIPIVIAVVVVFFVFRRVLKLSGATKQQRELAARLAETGTKARATIVGIKSTGMVVNDVNVSCEVTFEIQPIAGGSTFDGVKKMLLNQVNMPEIGTVWPCWFDPADRSLFAIGQPKGDARENIEVFREFGIPHPLDPTTGLAG